MVEGNFDVLMMQSSGGSAVSEKVAISLLSPGLEGKALDCGGQRFRLVRMLSLTLFGRIWEAEYADRADSGVEDSPRRVAIKLSRVSGGPDRHRVARAVEDPRAEAQSLRRLGRGTGALHASPAHVVNLIASEVVTDVSGADVCVTALELGRGDLFGLVEGGRGLGAEWLHDGETPGGEGHVVEALQQVIRGVESMHKRGCAHLDLSLENILAFDASREAKLRECNNDTAEIDGAKRVVDDTRLCRHRSSTDDKIASVDDKNKGADSDKVVKAPSQNSEKKSQKGDPAATDLPHDEDDKQKLRDIKCILPMAEPPEQRLTLKICDLGMARWFPVHSSPEDSAPSPRMSTKNGTPGKIGYMSPEVANEVSFCPFAADVYSLGVIMFILLTGYPPYEVPDAEDTRFLLAHVYGTRGIRRLLDAYGKTNVSDDACELMAALLGPESKRPPVQEILKHSFFAQRATHCPVVVAST